jgi:hypothetical protein
LDWTRVDGRCRTNKDIHKKLRREAEEKQIALDACIAPQ